MPEERVRFQMRVLPETDAKIKAAMQLENCQSQNEFVEKAVASPLFTPSRNAGRGNGFVRYLGGNAHYFSNMTWHRFLRRDIGIGMDSPADARCHKRFVCHHRRHYGQVPAPCGF